MKRVRSFTSLPKEYELAYECDMLHNTITFLIINIGSFVLLIPFIIIGMVYQFELIFSLPSTLLFLVLMFLMIIVHELVHAIFFKLGTTSKVKFAFHGFAASASVPGTYFYKRHYLVIGLAPAIILNLAFLIPLFFTQGEYFLVLYVLLAVHFASCIGDFYVAYKLIPYKKDTLIEDTGIGMKFFIKEK